MRLFSKPHGSKVDHNIRQHRLDKPQATSYLCGVVWLFLSIRYNFRIPLDMDKLAEATCAGLAHAISRN